MKLIPDTTDPAVLRTDFGDDASWSRLCGLISSPIGAEGFRAYMTFLSDPEFVDVTPESLPERLPKPYQHSFIVIADHRTFAEADAPLLVVDLLDKPGRSIRALPTRIGAIENNLSIGNMGFAEFAEAAGGDGLFRGFPGETEDDYMVTSTPQTPVRKRRSQPQTLLGRGLIYIYKLLRGKPGT